jgi:hypothetical protein
MIDTAQFFTHLVEIARVNLPYTPGGTDTARAARTAIQEAHTNLSQLDFFAAVDALGGFERLRASVIQALEDPEE